MPIYNIKWSDWFLYLLLYSLHCSWFYSLLCSYRCCDTHRMSNIKVCVRGYLTSYMDICELTAVFFGVFIGDKSSSFLERHTSCWAASLLPGKLLVQVRRVCGYQSVYRLSQCSSAARLNKMATKQNRSSTDFLLHLIKTAASKMAKGQKAR